MARYDDRTTLDDWLTSLRAPGRRFRRQAPPPAGGGVATLEAMQTARAEQADVERLAAVHEKLREAAEVLRNTEAVRAAVTERLVDRHEVVAPPARRRLRLMLIAVAILAACAAGVAAGATLLSGDSPSVPPRPAAAVAVQPCSAVPAGAGAVTCTTGTTLTIASVGSSVALPGTEARVHGVARAGDGVVVRVRMRNGTATSQSLDDRLYLSLRGRRIDPAVAAGAIPAGATRTLSLRFPLAAGTAGSADLGIVPFGASAEGRPDRLGVVRLTLP